MSTLIARLLAVDIVERLCLEDIADTVRFEKQTGEESEHHRVLASKSIGLYGWCLAQGHWMQAQRDAPENVTPLSEERRWWRHTPQGWRYTA